jgi:hypothetical protein
MDAMVLELNITSVSCAQAESSEAISEAISVTIDDDESMTWILLIYIVPSHPSRLRAAIWRDLKKTGSVYLRDGVAVLPDRTATRTLFRAVAARIAEFEGEATLVEGARLDEERAEAVIAQSRDGRTGEYREIAREAERLLAHLEQEQAHRDIARIEAEEIAADLDKLRWWAGQVRARDHFGAAADNDVEAALTRCQAALAELLMAAQP